MASSSDDGTLVSAAPEREDAALNLRKFDLNLLVIFQAIMTRGSVVGAADQVGLSPSAVSHALSRLRTMFNDELFRRTPRGLEPTDRALELGARVAAGLDHIAEAIERQHRFDPARSDRVFTMRIADYVSGMVLPALTRRLRREAPGVSVDVLPFQSGGDPDRSVVDVQVKFSTGGPCARDTRTRRLLTDEFLVVMRPDHHAAGEALTVELYARLSHVRLSPAAIGTTLIDDALARRGLRRHIVMTVPSWFDLPPIIESTDLIAIVPGRWLRADTRLGRLVVKELPLPEVGFAIDLCWDIRSERDAGLNWFRGLITDVFEAES